ncbi:hypothetical protein SELMODRAFT_177466 [Selaginella moellendorffii]|uniref:4-coumarate--CoA ligase n=1 Tax=Selaginella moellendorffii TaxID=88036 RepID=D8S6I0_SELML|nr:4-coumarate--CoA ligase 1 [Selaginella moellendorffii]EFJ20067.1 hypothetical protein SELMODRAFT_177466 [Selaginella moellendorffii]|eukprot:XP_002979110.1 4-coumarate--CoA ligase 1 [Selaginella moellendorffii]
MADSSGYQEDEGVYRSSRAAISLPAHPHQSFAAFLFSGPVGHPSNSSKPLIVDSSSGSFISCREFRERVEAVAGGLWSLAGVAQGDVVLVLLANTVHFPVIFHAALSIGAVVTTVNPANTAGEIDRQLRDSGAKFAVTSPELAAKLGDPTRLSVIVLVDGETSCHGSRFLPFRKLLEFKSGTAPENLVRIRLSDPAALLYSSGTTGPSKGVILSHGNLIASVTILSEQEKPSVSIALLPLFHVAGLVVSACLVIRKASTLIVLKKFDLVAMLEAIQRFKITTLPLVPPIVVALMKNPASAKYDLSSVTAARCGAAPLKKEIQEAFLTKFPHIQDFFQGFGMTETTGMGAFGEGPPGSSGKLSANHEAKVVDLTTGKPLPPNFRGELLLRGPCIMQGYLNNPAATLHTIDKDGWLHTGDIVFFDSNGCLFVVDRLKELIKYKGYQVAPAELEAVLLTHPAIVDAGVIPYPDEDAGEIPMAYIVRAAGESLSKSDAMKFVAEQVAPHKRIHRIEFLDAIPKLPSGKILRKDLIALAASDARSKL